MPNRDERMHSVEEYLRTREEARKPQFIPSAFVVGMFMISFGALMSGMFWFKTNEVAFLWQMGAVFLGLGAAFVILAMKGSAKHRATEGTRYPQQTGELHDLFFQILGENYLWFIVAWGIITLSLLAWMMR